MSNSANDGKTEFCSAYANRRNRLRALLRERNLDAMLVSTAANRFYLSGFELHDPQPNESAGCLVISIDGDDWLATDSRYKLAAEKLWPADRIFIYGSDMARELRGLLARLGSSIGLETKGISWNFARRLLAESGEMFRPAFARADGLVEKLRIIKEPCEIEALKASFKLNHAMLAWLENRIADGMENNLSEKRLAWEIERYFRENGAQELAFASIVASGPNTALPHAIPADGIIGKDQPLLTDAGCRVNNYCSDQTRTWWFGSRPSKEFSRTYDLVRKAQEKAIKMMRPGVSCARTYEAARDVFARAGVEKAFTHALGHGVGLETHEAPSLSPRSDMTLEQGMTVTVEPGLYYGEWGGVRLEYTVLVEENGVSIL